MAASEASALKATLLILAALALTVTVAEPAAAMCVIEQHTIDPVKQDTGTVVDKAVITYSTVKCHPPPE